jgi:restriction system protein
MAKASTSSAKSSVPTHGEIKEPLLSLLRRKGEVSLPDALAFVAKKFALSKSAQARKQGCGKETVLQNRLRWAPWELQREGKVETTRRGYFRLCK